MGPTITIHNWDNLPEVTKEAIQAMSSAILDFVESPKWWLSWEADTMDFEIHTPWWISGHAYFSDDTDREIICAAVAAKTEEDAKAYIIASHDDPPNDLNWKFCQEKEKDWNPFSDRFPCEEWMKWI